MISPSFTFLAYRLEGAYSKMKNLKPVEDFLRECAQSNLDAFTHLVDVPDLEFQYSNCGFPTTDLQLQCPQCKRWDTIGFMDSNMVDSSRIKQPHRVVVEPSKKETGKEA